jgi:hypothetical protein
MVSKTKNDKTPFFQTNLKARLADNFSLSDASENPQDPFNKAAAEESKNAINFSSNGRSRRILSCDSDELQSQANKTDISKKLKNQEHTVKSRENSVDDVSDNGAQPSRVETVKSVSNIGSEIREVQSAFKIFLMTTNSRY